MTPWVRPLFAFSILLLTGILPCRATTFDWPTSPSFPSLSPTNGQTVTQVYSGLGAISLTNNGGDTWETGYPAVNNTETTGGGTANGFQLYIKSEPSSAANIKVTLSFGYTGGVTGVSLTLWDVDSSASLGSTQFTDIIKDIVGVTASGVLVPLTVVGTSGYNTVTGSGTVNATATGTANATNTTNEGNVTVTYSGTTPIQEITFSYSNGATGLGAQAIGISPITFTPIGSATPEVGAALGGLILCGGVVGFGVMRKRRNAAGAQDSL